MSVAEVARGRGVGQTVPWYRLRVSGRLVSLGVAIALLVALAGAIIAACYEVPTPDCGFVCGPDSACPDRYTCASDHRCHRIGAPSTLVCSTPDDDLPHPDCCENDAPADGPLDAMNDAAVDAMNDAAVDAANDAADDAPDDAPGATR
jgi:hypothetical protein